MGALLPKRTRRSVALTAAGAALYKDALEVGLPGLLGQVVVGQRPAVVLALSARVRLCLGSEVVEGLSMSGLHQPQQISAGASVSQVARDQGLSRAQSHGCSLTLAGRR